MKKVLSLITIGLLIGGSSMAQTNAKRASLDSEGRITLEDIQIDESIILNSRDADMLPGFPFGRHTNPTFKNTRGVTLADIDNDGTDEIIFGADSILFCLDGDGSILWERALSGTNILPPTVADMDNDGNLEIAVNNAGLGAFGTVGQVYLMDSNGDDLEGWPVNFDDHWMINAPVMADVDGDGIMEIVTGERVSGSVGFIHVLQMDGTELDGWPVETTGNVAFTPSVGDINNDGTMDVISGQSADGSLYAFDASGTLLDGFPQIATDGKFSYQSPLLADLNGDENLEIVGSRHGDGAEYYAVKSDGTYAEGWPVASPGWTYSPPSITDSDADGDYEIFMGNPNTDGSEVPEPLDVIYGFAPDASALPNFPISKVGGNEGVITVADIDNNGVVDIIFTSNIFTLEDGKGFIHAYAMDGSGELEGFPLRTPALSFLNSAILGDINDDGMLDLTSLSYRSTFGQSTDSVFIAAFDLELPYMPENIYFNAYKGSNDRAGVVPAAFNVGVNDRDILPLSLYPNPAAGNVTIQLPSNSANSAVRVYDIRGRKTVESNINGSGSTFDLNISTLKSGIYFVQIIVESKTYMSKLIVE